MAFTHSELLDDLNAVTHELLGDAAITVRQNRPQSVIDPDLSTRVIDVDTDSTPVVAVEGFDGKAEVAGHWTRARSWHVNASDLGFVPARGGLIDDARGITWRIFKVEQRNNAREYEIFGELLA